MAILVSTFSKIEKAFCGYQSPKLVAKEHRLQYIKPVFHLATSFARREEKTRIRHRDWPKLAGEKIRREQVGTVPTFLSIRANKVAKWKTGFTLDWGVDTLGFERNLSGLCV